MIPWPFQFRSSVSMGPNYHGSMGETYGSHESKHRLNWILRDGILLVRMQSHLPCWSVYRYYPDGSWHCYELTFMWWRPRSTVYNGGYSYRIRFTKNVKRGGR